MEKSQLHWKELEVDQKFNGLCEKIKDLSFENGKELIYSTYSNIEEFVNKYEDVHEHDFIISTDRILTFDLIKQKWLLFGKTL